MKALPSFLLSLPVAFLLAGADDAPISLESKDGKAIQATILTTAEDSVHVKRADGKEFDIAFARLSDETVKRIKARAMPKDTNPPAESPPATEPAKSDERKPDSPRGGVTTVDSNDAEMNAAMKKARDTFANFWEIASVDARRASPRLAKVMVKARFNDEGQLPDRAEHLWLTQVEYDGKTITGIIQNQPDHLKSVTEGDSVGFPLDRLSDWIYVQEHFAYGATTVRVIRSRLSEADRSAHDAGWGCRFDGPPGGAEAGAGTPPAAKVPEKTPPADPPAVPQDPSAPKSEPVR